MSALDTGAYPYAPKLGVQRVQDIGSPAAQTVNPADMLYCNACAGQGMDEE
ncbi:hypothetical protein MKY92_20005 [Paenibacillus sp. FSL R5-0623]|uniref:hypothetical protein n=1 Tax=Paenibacillus sp. FSL R5-0623 TaxID=2921651 RepID=UPI0030DAA39F